MEEGGETSLQRLSSFEKGLGSSMGSSAAKMVRVPCWREAASLVLLPCPVSSQVPLEAEADP